MKSIEEKRTEKYPNKSCNQSDMGKFLQMVAQPNVFFVNIDVVNTRFLCHYQMQSINTLSKFDFPNSNRLVFN